MQPEVERMQPEVKGEVVGQPRADPSRETLFPHLPPRETFFKELDDVRYSVKVDIELSAATSGSVIYNRFRTYVDRVHTIHIYKIALLYWEDCLLCKKSNMFIAGAQVLCWRRTTLEMAAFFQFFSFFFAIAQLVRAANGDYEDFGDGRVFGMEVGDYAKFFRGYVVLEYVYKSSTVAAQGFAFVAAGWAVWRWRTFTASAKFTAYGYAISYFMPFAMLLCLPFQSGVDIRAIQKQFCRDIVEGAGDSININSSWAPQKLLNTIRDTKILGAGAAAAPMLGLNSTYGLRSMLRDTYKAELPEDFCEIDAEQWAETVKSILHGTGRLIKDGETTCLAVNITTGTGTAAAVMDNAASQLPDLTQDPAAAIAKCESSTCQACGASTCLTLMPTLQSSASLAMSSARAQAYVNSDYIFPKTPQAALKGMGLDETVGSINSCAGCLDELQGVGKSAATGQIPSCASLCLPLWAEGLASYSGSANLALDVVLRLNASFTKALDAALFAAKAADTAELLKVCVKVEDLELLEALLTLVTATRPWLILIGMRLSARALSVLLPCNFAMMLGTFKGACVSKTVLPYSRVPGLIVVCAVVFTLPHLLTILVAFKSIMGDWTLIMLSICFLLSQLVYLPWQLVFGDWCCGNGLLEPATHADAADTISSRQNCALFFQIGMLFFVCVFIAMSEHLRDFMKLGLVEVDFRAAISAQVFDKDFWRFVGWTALNICCKMYGMTRISCVFFADACLYTVLMIDEEDADPQDEEFRQLHGEKEHHLFVELHNALDPMRRKTTLAESNDTDPVQGQTCFARCCGSLSERERLKPRETE